MSGSAFPSAVVIVPIHNAASDLDACLTSLQRTLPAEARVLLADDASSDPAIGEVISRFQTQANFRVDVVRRTQNLGFIGNVNLAFAETRPDDVVLLNSDTLVSTGWLQRLLACAASDARIATATPWSNNAEICSFPDFCRAAAMPVDIDALAAAAADVDTAQYPELPTGVGFCMYVRRAALDAIGDFDQATFGRGYGEENDFCMRAAAHGWRNVLCETAYVAHRGGASFAPQGHCPGGDNLRKLVARYPAYNGTIAEFILRDPLRPFRDQFAERMRARGLDPAKQSQFA